MYPTFVEACRSALIDELRFLHESALDETLDAEMRSDFTERIPRMEQLLATVTPESDIWLKRYPLKWYETIYNYYRRYNQWEPWAAADEALSLAGYDAKRAQDLVNLAHNWLKEHPET